MKFAVIVFPGSNCDLDMYHAIRDELGEEAEYVWHTETNLERFDAVLLPGGFSYGDHLRCGAIARFSPIIEAVKRAANNGIPVLGVCNGFQVLLEAGLLPGAMQRNAGLKFICKPQKLRVVNNETPFTNCYAENEQITVPIAHGEGNYYCDEKTLEQLIAQNRILFTYEGNPNGSIQDIAGIMNEQGNVLGMMPHPERAISSMFGSADGIKLFKSIVQYWREIHVVNA